MVGNPINSILKITTVYSGGATSLGYKHDKNVIK